MLRKLRNQMARHAWTARAMDAARPIYRRLRTRYLRARYPRGGYVTGNGVRVFCDFDNPTYAWYDADTPNLGFDVRVVERVVAQSRGSVFIDVGAHFGFYSALLARLVERRIPPSTLIAVEPDAANFTCLEQTVAPYGALNKVLLPIGLGDVDATLPVYRTPKATCLHTFADAEGEVCGSVAIRSLDTLVPEVVPPGERIAFIKVDIDGAEPSFLRGAERTIAEHRPLVFMEFGPAGLRSGGTDPRAFFRELCDRFIVYWAAFDRGVVRRVSHADYEEIAAAVEDRVTDVVLSDRELDLSLDRRLTA